MQFTVWKKAGPETSAPTGAKVCTSTNHRFLLVVIPHGDTSWEFEVIDRKERSNLRFCSGKTDSEGEAHCLAQCAAMDPESFKWDDEE